MRSIHRQEKGYTLVELMVAVSILGTLAGTAATAEQKYMNAGRAEALRVEYKTIVTATQAYLNDNNRLPSTDDQLAMEGYIDSVPTLADYTIDPKGRIIQAPKPIPTPQTEITTDSP